MRIVWTPQAERDRLGIRDFIAAEDPHAAKRIDELFAAAVANLVRHPLMGAIGRIPGSRELVPHESFRIVYEIQEDALWILAVVHTARNWPPVSTR